MQPQLPFPILQHSFKGKLTTFLDELLHWYIEYQSIIGWEALGNCRNQWSNSSMNVVKFPIEVRCKIGKGKRGCVVTQTFRYNI